MTEKQIEKWAAKSAAIISFAAACGAISNQLALAALLQKMSKQRAAYCLGIKPTGGK